MSLLQVHPWLAGWRRLWDCELWRNCIRQLAGCLGLLRRMLTPHGSSPFLECGGHHASLSWGKGECLLISLLLLRVLLSVGRSPVVTSSYPQDFTQQRLIEHPPCASPWWGVGDAEIDRHHLPGGHTRHSERQTYRQGTKMPWEPTGCTSWASERSGKISSRRGHWIKWWGLIGFSR